MHEYDGFIHPSKEKGQPAQRVPPVVPTTLDHAAAKTLAPAVLILQFDEQSPFLYQTSNVWIAAGDRRLDS
jgi:hypothetical protein